MKVVTAQQMQQIDQECSRIGLATDALMENAGRAVAEGTGRILGDIAQHHILIMVGTGNNGGDGLVAARYLHDGGAQVGIYLMGQRPSGDVNLKQVQERGITIVEAARDENRDELVRLLSPATAVVDAIFGTGKRRPLEEAVAGVLNIVSEAKEERPGLRIVALDLPSGLNADSGAADPACLYADDTITLAFPKLGLFNPPGAERAGRVTIADIGIPAHLAEDVDVEVITDEWVRTALPRRPLLANKGSFGRVLVVAGSMNYVGAASLACSGAMRAGSGLVTLATAASLVPVVASRLTEVTYLPLPEAGKGYIAPRAARVIQEEMNNYDALLVGCGLGQGQSAGKLVKTLLLSAKLPLPLVLDADALNILAKIPEWWYQMENNAVLTPHPGEMGRLAGTSVDVVQKDRLGAAEKAAQKWHKTIVLKGAYTIVVAPGGKPRINPVANPGLASAGTGDVLAGVIAGLVAQGLTLSKAAACGVYIHGEAGEMVRAQLGDAGMVASDLLPALPLVIKQLKTGAERKP